MNEKLRLTGVAPSARTASACTGELKTRNLTPFQSPGPSNGALAANGRRSGPTVSPSPTTPVPSSRPSSLPATGPETRAFSAA